MSKLISGTSVCYLSDLWAEYDEDTEINYTIEDVKFEIVKSAKH